MRQDQAEALAEQIGRDNPSAKASVTYLGPAEKPYGYGVTTELGTFTSPAQWRQLFDADTPAELQQTNFRLPKRTLHRLRQLAALHHRTATGEVTHMIETAWQEEVES